MASVLFLLTAGPSQSAQRALLVHQGQPRAEIWVTRRTLSDDVPLKQLSATDRRLELERRRLRESVHDLIHYIEKMSGARLPLIISDTHLRKRRSTRILIGDLASARFGPPRISAPAGQGFRIVVEDAVVGLAGESDLGTSYAIYEVLHRLGSRWFMPGDLGEVIPQRPTISLPPEDSSRAPATHYRDIWYRDDAFARRNRLGGLKIQAGHALERYITREEREAHPEWCALIDGRRDPARPQLSWGNPEVAEAIALKIIAKLNNDYVDSISLSPMDSTAFGEGPEETALDAGDWDPTLHMPSLTDRLVSFANRIAARVSKEHPRVRLGLLSYVQYTRPPVKVRPHPNLTIELAPITYNRAHPMTDDRHPASADLRRIVAGWGKVTAGEFACYPYGYNLGEVSAPFPLIRKWSIDLPLLFRHGCKYWQPETLPNFETSLPGLYLGLRLAWDPSQEPAAIIDEFLQSFYPATADPMRHYWETMDRAWVETKEFSGNGWGHLQRFTPQVMDEARSALDEALDKADSIVEYRRVRLAERSFAQLEILLGMRNDLNEGRFGSLRRDAERWAGGHQALGNEHLGSYAFTTAPERSQRSLAVTYFNRFLRPTLESAETLHREARILTPIPMRMFRFRIDPEEAGLSRKWHLPTLDDSTWSTTDTGLETWSTLGHYGYMGSMWYRTTLDLETEPENEGGRIFLWTSAAANELEVFVNGERCPAVDANGNRSWVSSGYARPAHFDITSALTGAGSDFLALRARRDQLDELGVGGLLGPVLVYRQR
jgi:hypothetical protein